jgi:hypothetical protein
MWRRWLPFAVIFLLALALYSRTLVPYVYVSDWAEFQYQPLRLGLPHPNGFPFYMLLGWLWSHLPFETPAWRMNWLSAVSAALAVTLTAAFAWRLTRRPAVALLAGGLLALSTTFWMYSLAAERYTLNLALLVGAVWLAWEAGQAGNPRLAYLSALLLGLSLAVHPTDALLIPFWLIYLVWRLPAYRSSLRFWVLLAACGAAPMLLYAYVPWRWIAASAAPPAAGIGRSSAIYQGMVHVWYQPQLTPELLWQYIGGLGGYGRNLAAGGWREALARLPEIAPYWRAEVPWIIVLMAVAGAAWLGRRHGALLAILIGFAALLSFVVAYIQQGKYEAYLLPAFWVTLFLAALSVGWLADGIERLSETNGAAGRLGRGALLLVVGLGLLLILQRQYGRQDRSRQTETARWWDITLRQPIEPEAGLLGHWSDLTPLWYLQQIEGRRTDLLGLFPPDMDAVVMPWIEAGKPLYLAAPLQEWAPDLPARLQMMPWGTMVRLTRPGEEVTCPTMAHPAEASAGWPFALTSWETDGLVSGAAPGALRFCWRAEIEIPRNTFLALEMRREGDALPLRANEPLISQWYPLDHTPAGIEGMATVPLPLPLGAPPGRYDLTLTPYLMQEDGSALAWPGAGAQTLGQVEVLPTHGFQRARLRDEIAPPIPLHAGPLALRAWRLSDEIVRPGDPLRLDMVWEVRAPMQEAPSLVVDFREPGGSKTTSAPQPALSPADASLAPGTLLYASYSLPAPRARGDRTYIAVPVLHSLRSGDAWLPWLPAGRLSLGTVRVHDRPHLEELPEGVQPLEATFGQAARLRGHAPGASEIGAGDELEVTFYWEALEPTDASYRAFVHLVDAAGNIVAQHDGIPAGGELPTNIWAQGEIVADTHTLSLPPDLAPGAYALRLGLYLPDTGERLPVTGDQPHPDNALEVGTINVGP